VIRTSKRKFRFGKVYDWGLGVEDDRLLKPTSDRCYTAVLQEPLQRCTEHALCQIETRESVGQIECVIPLASRKDRLTHVDAARSAP
jgi:hypothetical protein